MTTTLTPTLSTVVTAGYLADQVTYAVNVTYPGETPRRVRFTGSVIHGGPVVMHCERIAPRGMFVDEPARFGTFGADWVRRFFTDPVVP